MNTDRHPISLGKVMDTPHGLKDLYWRKWMEYGKPQYDSDERTGRERVREEWCTCGTCGRDWNEAYITGRTPAPSARCPFEDEHEAEGGQQ